MIKYMGLLRLMFYALAMSVGVYTVTLVTTDKLRDLRAESMLNAPQFASVKDRERQLKCMADNVYWEAGNEPAEGKIAVAQVVMNRAASGQFPDDVCKVIYQKNVFYERVVCQFSWYCESYHRTRHIHKETYDESMDAAKLVLMEGFRLSSVKDAMYYHADYVNPQWNKIRVAKIGRHIFYKDKET